VERSFSELKPKEDAAPAAAQQPGGVRSGDTTGQGPQIHSVSPDVKALGENDSKLGKDLGGGFRGCVPGDNSPPGTVQDGFKKTVAQTLMGASCLWEPVK